MIECESSLEIVDREVSADFNTETEDHSPQKKMTGIIIIDSFGIVDMVPVDFNTGKDHSQDPHDLQPNSSGSMESDTESTELTEYTTLDVGRTQLPVDSIASNDIFQKKLKVNFLNTPGVPETEADMVVFGKTNWEQDGNLLNSFGTRRNDPNFKSPTILQGDTWRKG